MGADRMKTPMLADALRDATRLGLEPVQSEAHTPTPQKRRRNRRSRMPDNQAAQAPAPQQAPPGNATPHHQPAPQPYPAPGYPPQQQNPFLQGQPQQQMQPQQLPQQDETLLRMTVKIGAPILFAALADRLIRNRGRNFDKQIKVGGWVAGGLLTTLILSTIGRSWYETIYGDPLARP